MGRQLLRPRLAALVTFTVTWSAGARERESSKASVVVFQLEYA
jgi:hypothetical protein